MARLGSKKRQHIKRRAKKEVAREYAGAGAGTRQAIKQANREYGRTASDARGAQAVQLSQLNRMLSNVRDSGLKGKYAAQTAADLRARKTEAISGLPFMLSQAAEDRTDAIGSIRADAAQLRSEKQQAIGSRTNDLLEDARKSKADRLEDRRDARKENKGVGRGVKNAMLTANTYLKNATAEEKAALLADKKGFALAIAKDSEGADGVDAMKAINLLERRRKKRARKSVTKAFSPWLEPGR